MRIKKLVQIISCIALTLFLLSVLVMPASAQATSVTNEQELTNALSAKQSPIYIKNDISITSKKTISYDLELSSNGATLSWNGSTNNSMLSLSSNCTLTTSDITLDGLGKAVTLVGVPKDNTYVMNSGTILKNTTTNSNCSAVRLGANGSEGGSFIMNSGVITGVMGDHVVRCYGSSITMSGDALITENKAYGIAMIGGELNMTDMSEISFNTTSGGRPGAGILASNAAIINMGLKQGDAPRIYKNETVDSYCGGIYLTGESVLNMDYDSSISHNKAYSMAGGVAAAAASVKMKGNAAICGNTTTNGAAGGLFLQSGAAIISENSLICGNSVLAEDGIGGGVYMKKSSSEDDCTLILSGNALITGNSAAIGSGAYISAGQLTVSQSAKIGDVKTDNGVYLSSNQTLTVDNLSKDSNVNIEDAVGEVSGRVIAQHKTESTSEKMNPFVYQSDAYIVVSQKDDSYTLEVPSLLMVYKDGTKWENHGKALTLFQEESGITVYPNTLNEDGSVLFTSLKTNTDYNIIIDDIDSKLILWADNNGCGNADINYFTVTARAEAGGIISPEGETILLRGQSEKFTITPDSGYKIFGLYVDSVDMGALKEYEFTAADKAVAIIAKFKKVVTPPAPHPCDGGDSCPSKHLVDVDTTKWYHEAIDYMVVTKTMNGISSTLFAPDGNLTRAMMAQIFYNMEGRPQSGTANFSDVSENAWYASAIAWSRENNIVYGIGNNLFAPNNSITREQMALMLYNYCSYKGIILPKQRAGLFEDAAQTSAWAETAFNAMYKAEILSGRGNGLLYPKATSTRAEVAAMFMNFMKR